MIPRISPLEMVTSRQIHTFVPENGHPTAPNWPPTPPTPRACAGPAHTPRACPGARGVSGPPTNWARPRDLGHPDRPSRCRPPPWESCNSEFVPRQWSRWKPLNFRVTKFWDCQIKGRESCTKRVGRFKVWAKFTFGAARLVQSRFLWVAVELR